ncbi:response regulator [Xanthobacter versatilis]|uniref:Two component transcriptional regulator, winged helix family n=1 Tax=Xanthobacter autotrophicus (strain ATCC BAA-1158 / Py2) TaxID=78245 RepID=A7IHL4_XANP2|nr:two component transcriptional regulator, winged helix family [Xanthobacter autotrophicus Py2]
MRILIVEDDRSLASGLKRSLTSLGYAVDHEADVADAVGLATREAYNLVVLDLGLPNGSGYDVLRAIRRNGLKTPVMILTARDHVSEKVKALDLGADDYVHKPFALAEFEARVRALVRRGFGVSDVVLEFGPLQFDTAQQVARLEGSPLDLRRRELAVLHLLLLQAGKLVPKARLISEVFGLDDAVGPNALELYIARLRKKLGAGGLRIRTVRGLGYMLERG